MEGIPSLPDSKLKQSPEGAESWGSTRTSLCFYPHHPSPTGSTSLSTPLDTINPSTVVCGHVGRK